MSDLSRRFLFVLLILTVFVPVMSAGEFEFKTVPQEKNGRRVELSLDGKTLLSSPQEGLWSVATDWKEKRPDKWQHIPATEIIRNGEWTILSGSAPVSKDGELFCRDVYRMKDGFLHCTRRFEYKGTAPLKKITLSVRWQATGKRLDAFLPGILYYGNPSGEKYTPKSVPVYHGKPGEFAIFEEHRYPMPFACLEDRTEKRAMALHTVPGPVAGGTVPDQWWTLGVSAIQENLTELVLFSGFMGYNGQNSVAKALQRKPLDYPDATITLYPGMIIEKSFMLDLWSISSEGTAFERPVERSIHQFAPFYMEDLPPKEEIIRQKLEFARSRWIEGEGYAGFNMYPANYVPKIVMGWCGQADAPGFALQCLRKTYCDLGATPEEKEKNDKWLIQAVQRSLDHLSTATFNEQGFSVVYNTETKKWENKTDHVSMGQAMYDIAKAIKKARDGSLWSTERWERFLRQACDFQAERILKSDWYSRSTAEAFYIAPLILSADLFQSDRYRQAAQKAADTFMARHLLMKEPYWGGTLDATCEDKEGAWAAFQGFLAMYDSTGDVKYLQAAKHACDVCLSYLVVWDIPLPAGRLADHRFRTRGWTVVSPQNQHLDVYGVLFAPEVYRIGQLLNKSDYQKAALVMFRSCGQLIDPFGSQGEQIQQTNFAQRGDMTNVLNLRGGYAEGWTVFWITTHFLISEAKMTELQK